ncbi:Macrolide export ATP-binding/permease protein MacB [compost metagenome]
MLTILSVDKVTKQFRKHEVVLKNVTLDIKEGTFTAMIGASGSGKSTLLNIMSGLLKPTSGSVLYKGKNLTMFDDNEIANFLRNEVGLIFQNYYLLSHLTVEENINIGISNTGRHYELNEISKVLGIENLLRHFPSELSGGQQQRVAIARAIMKKPSILYCDEATGALDEANSKKVISLLHRIRQQYGITIIFITHNHEIARTADRVITIKDGMVYRDTTCTNPISVEQMSWA